MLLLLGNGYWRSASDFYVELSDDKKLSIICKIIYQNYWINIANLQLSRIFLN